MLQEGRFLLPGQNGAKLVLLTSVTAVLLWILDFGL
jgi:homospermidine synthase